MSTVLLALGVAIVALVVLDHIPGLRYAISPMMSGIASLIAAATGSFAGWTAWIVKTLWHDHVTLARHLVSRREAIDATDPYRRA